MTLSLMQAQPVLEQIRDLPWLAHAVAGGMLVAGAILWLFGRKVMRGMIMALAALVGAGLGLFLQPMITGGASAADPAAGGETVQHLPIWLGLLIGAGLGAIIGFVVYRFAVALGLGVALAGVIPLGVAAIFAITPPPIPDQTTEDAQSAAAGVADHINQLGERLRDLDTSPSASSLTDPDHKPADIGVTALTPETQRTITDAAADMMKSVGERLTRFVQIAREEIGRWWDGLSDRDRVVYAGSAAAGLILGLVVGFLLPAWGAGIVSAMIGAAVMLGAGSWLWHAMGFATVEVNQRIPGGWLTLWAAMAAIGVGAQWSGLVSRKRKASAAAE